VTKDARTEQCVVVPSQCTGSAVSEGQVVFSVFSAAGGDRDKWQQRKEKWLLSVGYGFESPS
jgi:hypothetical protein